MTNPVPSLMRPTISGAASRRASGRASSLPGCSVYRRYVALGSVWGLKDELDRDGVRSKVRVDRYGRETGGKALARGALYLMLQNRIYRGEIAHKEASYPGEHDPIVDQALWDEVQCKLISNRTDRANGAGAQNPSLLAGLLYDDLGARMSPTHANKKGARYRYYVSSGLVRGRRSNAPSGRRVPAADLEALVDERLRLFLMSASEVYAAIEPHVAEANRRADLVGRAADVAQQWNGMTPSERRATVAALVDRIDLMPETVEIRIQPVRLISMLSGSDHQLCGSPASADHGPSLTLAVRARLKRAGMETRLLVDGPNGAERRKADHSIHRVLALAHRYQAMLMRSDGTTMAQLAAEAGVAASYFTRVLRLSFLAPDVAKAILHDKHPLDLTAKRLVNETRVSIAWADQRALIQSR